MRRFLALLLAAFVAGTLGPLISGLSPALGLILVALSVARFSYPWSCGTPGQPRPGSASAPTLQPPPGCGCPAAEPA